MNSTTTAHDSPATGLLRYLVRAAVGCAVVLGTLCAHAQDKSTIVIKGKDGWLFPRWGSLTTVDLAGIDDTTRLIRQTSTLLQTRGIKLELVLLPDKIRFYQDKLPDGDKMSAQVQGRYGLILEKLRQNGINTFDGEAVLRQVQQSGQQVFYRTDQHWTQPAADATAEATAAMIQRDLPQLAGQPNTGMTLGIPTKERRYGDLAELFLTPDEKKQVGRDVFEVRKYTAANNLIDDAPASIHITGHSMVQPYFGFPQKLSNLLDRPVSLNWKSGNVGPWAMLLEYVESTSFQQHKPQVLVWQMFEPSFPQGPNATGMWDNAALMTDEVWLSRLKAAVGK